MLQLSPALLTRRSHFVFLFVLLCLAGSAATPFGRRVLAGYWPAVKRVLPLTTPRTPPPLLVPQTFTVANTADSGLGSLRQAILDANTNPGPDVIDATGVTGTITINPANYFLVITDDITINGPGQANLTISGGNASRIFWIQNGTVTIQDLTLADGLAKGGNGGGGGMGAGGAIFMHEGKQGATPTAVLSGSINLSLINVTLKDNKAQGGNGGSGNVTGGGGMGGNGNAGGASGGVLGSAVGYEYGGSVTDATVAARGTNGGLAIFGSGGKEGSPDDAGFGGGGGGNEDGGVGGGGGGATAGGGSFGRGGFGGGGGNAGTDNNYTNNGGARGGFGGGGGGLAFPGNGSNGNAGNDDGQAGFGAGKGTTIGGGGMGAGGAIFVASGALTMQNVRFQNNTAIGGTGGNNGQGLGGAVFIFNKADNSGAAAPGTTNDPQVKGCKVIYIGNTASTSDNNVFGSVGVVSGCDTSSIQLALDPVASPAGAAEELIGAITIANQDPAPTTIKLLCGTYRYSMANNWEFGPNALPIIQSNITIEGNGAVLDSTATTRLRFFYVAGQNVGNLTSGTLTLQDLTLQNGKQKGGDSRGNGGGSGMGGAIFNHGAVTLDRVTLQGNTATGGSSINGAVNFQDQGGGGIGEDGHPTQNQGGGFGGTPIGTGGTGGTSGSSSYGGGGGGFRPGDNGGNATFSAPGAGGGNGLLGGEGGGFGSGGGFERGAPGDGGGGGGRDASLPGSVGPGGAYGFGGIGGSVAGGGGGGVGGGGGGGIGGGGGFGGGGVGTSGTARGGGGGFGGGGGRGAGPGGFAGGNGGGCCNTFGGGGGGGLGGAIFNHLGTLRLINTTLTGNTAQGGNGSSSTQANNGGGGSGGSGFGGAIFNLNGTVMVTSSTLAGNTVTAGVAGTGTLDGSPGNADGGAIYNLAYGNTFAGGATTATVSISNSILATSTNGSVGTNDLVNDKRNGAQANTATVTFTNGNLVMAHTTLNSAITNGTPTLTSNPNLAVKPQVLSDCVAGMCKPAVLALQTNSPAIGAALGSSPATDQTGTARPLSTAAALGAYEPCGVTPNLSAALTDPIVCNGVGGIVIVTAQLTNLNNFQAGASFTANLPAELSAIAGSCTATPGTCNIINAGQVSWNGNLNANQTVTIQYQALVANGTPANQQLCINSTGTVAGLMRSVQACGTANCPPNNLNNPPTNIGVSSQKAGSLLVYPYYTAKTATKSDTRLTISNIGTTDTIAHLFFIDGTSCQQADFFVCLTANASFSFKASEYDPETTGWVLAVAVNKQGQPVQNNSLIGNAFVTDGNYVDNYGAESFFARSNDVAVLQNNTARLLFNDVGYEAVPDQFAVELQSPVDVPGQRLVTVGLLGDLTTSQLNGAAQVGVGLITNGNEKPSGSFSALLQGSCQALATISATMPRVPGGMATMIPSSQVGTIRFNVGASVGLLLTPRGAPNRWHGIRALHKTHTTFSILTIPLVIPVC